MKISIPGLGSGSSPYPTQQRQGATARVHDQPLLSIEQAMASARARQAATDAARADEARIAARLKEPYRG